MLCRVKFRQKIQYAGVVKLADTQDLGSCAARCAGSSPVTRTSRVTSAGQFGYHFVIIRFPLCTTGYHNLFYSRKTIAKLRNAALHQTLF